MDAVFTPPPFEDGKTRERWCSFGHIVRDIVFTILEIAMAIPLQDLRLVNFVKGLTACYGTPHTCRKCLLLYALSPAID